MLTDYDLDWEDPLDAGDPDELAPPRPVYGYLLNTDGTAVLVRILPDTPTIGAVLGSHFLGHSPAGADYTFWHRHTAALILFPTPEPYGEGEPNRLARTAYRSLTGERRRRFNGAVLLTSEGDGNTAVDIAVWDAAESVVNASGDKRHVPSTWCEN